MRYIGVLVILASLVLLTKSATANVLSASDYENFRNLDLKMLSIVDDIYGLVTNQPGTHAPDCVIELAFKFDTVQADLHGKVRWWPSLATSPIARTNSGSSSG